MEIKGKSVEDWFRENWEKFEDDFSMESFMIRNSDAFSESFLREFKDVIGKNLIVFYTKPNIDFLRELNPINHTGEANWTERQIEEFRDYVRWYDMFIHNWNLSNDFIKKWINEVHGTFDDIIIERNKNRYDNDPEYRRLVNEQLQMLIDIGLDVY